MHNRVQNGHVSVLGSERGKLLSEVTQRPRTMKTPPLFVRTWLPYVLGVDTQPRRLGEGKDDKKRG